MSGAADGYCFGGRTMKSKRQRQAADENLPVGQASSLPLPTDSQAGSLRHGTKAPAARLPSPAGYGRRPPRSHRGQAARRERPCAPARSRDSGSGVGSGPVRRHWRTPSHHRNRPRRRTTVCRLPRPGVRRCRRRRSLPIWRAGNRPPARRESPSALRCSAGPYHRDRSSLRSACRSG